MKIVHGFGGQTPTSNQIVDNVSGFCNFNGCANPQVFADSLRFTLILGLPWELKSIFLIGALPLAVMSIAGL